MPLEFVAKNHTYLLDGKRIPCVSDLCRFLHRELYRDTPQWRMEAAAERGTAVHAATVSLDANKPATIAEENLPYVEAYRLFLTEHTVRWTLTEHPLYHPAHFYAGTIDRYGLIDGRLALVDIKTTYSLQKALCRAQLNLYRMMLEARGYRIERLYILHLKKDGSYRLHPFPMENNLPYALLELHKALPKRKGENYV